MATGHLERMIDDAAWTTYPLHMVVGVIKTFAYTALAILCLVFPCASGCLRPKTVVRNSSRTSPSIHCTRRRRNADLFEPFKFQQGWRSHGLYFRFIPHHQERWFKLLRFINR